MEATHQVGAVHVVQGGRLVHEGRERLLSAGVGSVGVRGGRGGRRRGRGAVCYPVGSRSVVVQVVPVVLACKQ